MTKRVSMTPGEIERALENERTLLRMLRSAVSDFEMAIEEIPNRQASRWQRDAMIVEARALAQRIAILHGYRLESPL